MLAAIRILLQMVVMSAETPIWRPMEPMLAVTAVTASQRLIG